MSERVLSAKLPNGRTVAINEQGTVPPNKELVKRGEELACLLANPETHEVSLLEFLANVGPAVFPTCDPSSKIEIEPKMEMVLGRPDLAFRIAGSNDYAVVEIKSPRQRMHPKAHFEKGIHQLLSYLPNRYPSTAGTIPSFKEGYLIAGRRGDMPASIESMIPKGLQAKIFVYSWDDITDHLIKPKSTPPDEYTIILVELVDTCRRLLTHLCKNPHVLDGLNDRQFEEVMATLFHDLGFEEVELTPPRKDGGRDIVMSRTCSRTRLKEVYLAECKHWLHGRKVTYRWALSLLNVVENEKACGGILIAPNGFGPKLLEQEISLEQKGLKLRDKVHIQRWLSIWQRTYGNVLVENLNPLKFLNGDK